MTPDSTTPAASDGWAPKPADTVTPHEQSLLVMRHLSDEQVRAYLGSSGLPVETSREQAALHFAEHRVTALQEAAAFREKAAKQTKRRSRKKQTYAVAPPELPAAAQAELTSAKEVGQAAGRLWQRLSTWSAIVGLVIGWGFLISGAVGVIPGLQVLFFVSAVCLALSPLLMFVVAPICYARGQRASRAALFEWAVHRPGQLERGLPGLHKRVDEDATSGSSFCLGLISMAVGGFCAVMGLVMIPISLLDQQATSWQVTGVLLGIGAVFLLSPRLVTRWGQWVRRRNDEIDEAVSWVYAAATPTSLYPR
ncbi:hypothetical protein [Ornithinimicrobium faecis]|uniref:hypothetical protein n=1 Tax=Ornithinimicrobium faecis TaxID=2934158 RepID=UPI0021195B42|nr:hypothetical protein [Ornithinimicrobium sp. HY1745]